jgi:hypothetical protein
MTAQMLSQAQNRKRKRLMQYFLDTPYYLVKGDVDDLDHEEAQLRWKLVKANYSGVCFRAGTGSWRSRDGWTSLMRKMIFLKDKAAEQPQEENEDAPLD